jgi:predicted RecA/RadA family phage recombinase
MGVERDTWDNEAMPISAPTAGTTAYTFIKVRGKVLLPLETKTVGLDVSVVARGRFRGAPKTASQVWVRGQELFWDDSAAEFTNVRADGVSCGAIAANAAASAATTGDVVLDGTSAYDAASNTSTVTKVYENSTLVTTAIADYPAVTVAGGLTSGNERVTVFLGSTTLNMGATIDVATFEGTTFIGVNTLLKITANQHNLLAGLVANLVAATRVNSDAINTILAKLAEGGIINSNET